MTRLPKFPSFAGDLARLIISKEHEFNYWQRCGLTVMNLILRQYAIIIKQIFLVVQYRKTTRVPYIKRKFHKYFRHTYITESKLNLKWHFKQKFFLLNWAP